MQANDAEGRKRQLIKGKRKREKEGSHWGGHRYLQEKRRFLPELQGQHNVKFWLKARNTIRAKARYITPPLRLPHLLTPSIHIAVVNNIYTNCQK